MAESYLITIKFAADNSTTKQIEKKLNSVFDRCTKRFKNGFSRVWNGLKFGAGIGAATTALTLLLGKFGQVNDKVNDLLQKADAIRTRAQGFGGSVQEYGFIEAYAGAKNVSAEQLAGYLGRIQNLLGQAQAGEENVLSNYAGETDAVKVFYNLIENMQKMDRNARASMAAQIFGRNAAVGLGDLLAEGFGDKKLLSKLQEQNWDEYASNVEKAKDLAGEQSLKKTLRDMEDFNTKAAMTSSETIQKQDEFYRQQNENENKMYGQYDKLADLQATSQNIEKILTDFTIEVLPLIRKSYEGLTGIAGVVQDMKEDPANAMSALSEVTGLKALGAAYLLATDDRPDFLKGGVK